MYKDLITSLGNLFQCLNTLTVIYFPNNLLYLPVLELLCVAHCLAM